MKIELNSNLAFEKWGGEVRLRSLTRPFTFEDCQIFQNYEVILILRELVQPKDESDVITLIGEKINHGQEDAQKIINDLVDEGVIWRSGDPRVIEEKNFKSLWGGGARLAAFFHQKTNNLPTFDYLSSGEKDDINMMKKYVQQETPPSNYKTYENMDQVYLKGSDSIYEKGLKLESIFSLSGINNKTKEVTLENLGEFLHLLLGEMGKRSLHVTGQHLAKTSPSGGARHPTEGYIEVFNVEGLKPGLYHYNVESHSLENIKSDILSEENQHKFYRYSHPQGFKANFVIYFTCIFERSMFRYRESRSYRVMQIDLGHLIQSGSFLCKQNGWNNFRSYAPPESIIEDRIGLKGFHESLMGLMAVGGA